MSPWRFGLVVASSELQTLNLYLVIKIKTFQTIETEIKLATCEIHFKIEITLLTTCDLSHFCMYTMYDFYI